MLVPMHQPFQSAHSPLGIFGVFRQHILGELLWSMGPTETAALSPLVISGVPMGVSPLVCCQVPLAFPPICPLGRIRPSVVSATTFTAAFASTLGRHPQGQGRHSSPLILFRRIRQNL
jgi:hypothetical protein